MPEVNVHIDENTAAQLVDFQKRLDAAAAAKAKDIAAAVAKNDDEWKKVVSTIEADAGKQIAAAEAKADALSVQFDQTIADYQAKLAAQPSGGTFEFMSRLNQLYLLEGHKAAVAKIKEDAERIKKENAEKATRNAAKKKEEQLEALVDVPTEPSLDQFVSAWVAGKVAEFKTDAAKYAIITTTMNLTLAMSEEEQAGLFKAIGVAWVMKTSGEERVAALMAAAPTIKATLEAKSDEEKEALLAQVMGG